MRPGQELGREVGYDACILLGIGFQGSDTLLEHPVPDSQRQSSVQVIASGGSLHTPYTAKQVVEK